MKIEIDDIRAVLWETNNIAPERITDDADLFDDLSLDSLEYQDMLFELEGKKPGAVNWLKLDITPQNAPRKVGELLALLKEFPNEPGSHN